MFLIKAKEIHLGGNGGRIAKEALGLSNTYIKHRLKYLSILTSKFNNKLHSSTLLSLLFHSCIIMSKAIFRNTDTTSQNDHAVLY